MIKVRLPNGTWKQYNSKIPATGEKSRRTAIQAAQRIQGVIDAGLDPFADVAAGSPLRLLEMIRQYLDDRRPAWSDNTYEIRADSLSKLVRTVGDVSVDSLDKAQLQAARAAIAVNLRPHSVNIHIRGWRAFLHWVRDEKLPEWKPPEISQVKAVAAEHRDYLTPDELERVLAAAEGVTLNGQSVASFLAFLAYTGMRRGEGLACEWGWMRGDAILVPAAITKNSKKRAVPILKRCRSILEGLPRSDARLFPAMTIEVSRRFRRACALAGIDRPLHLHNLRDTFCVAAILSGVPVTVVALWTGHDPRVLLGHYAAIGLQDTLGMVGRVDAGFGADVVRLIGK